ncbi:MAG: phage tail length tape measure family protein [Magnetococcales bacterium]|nr:phage tail length tape measure family protein [Magnetococcales bacterium]
MSKDLNLNIRLKADGADFQGAVNISRKELDKLSGSVNKSGTNLRRYATKTGQVQQGMERLQGGLVGVRDSMNLINGPLNGVSGRFTALTSVLNKSNLAWVGVGLGVGAAGFALQRGIAVAMNAERQQLRLGAVLKATGRSVGFSADQLDAYARKVALNTLASSEGVRNAMGVLLTFKTVTGKRFKDTIALSQDLAEVMGTNISGAAMQLGKALEDPANGLTALRRAGVSFAESEKELIKKLHSTGQAAEAQRLILKKVAEQVGGAGEAAAGGLAGKVDTLGQRWEELLETLGKTPAVANAVGGSLDFLSAALEGLTPDQNGRLVTLKRQRQALVAELEQIEKIRKHGYRTGDSAGDWWESVVQGDESFDAFLTGLTGNASKQTEGRWMALQNRIVSINKEIGLIRQKKRDLEKVAPPPADPAVINFGKASASATLKNSMLREESAEQQRAERQKVFAAASLKATARQYDIKERLRKEAEADHERSSKRIAQAQLSILPVYQQTKDRANQWFNEVTAGLDRNADDYEQLEKKAKDVLKNKLARAREEDLQSSQKWSDGVKRAAREYAEEAGNSAKQWERITNTATQSIEDGFTRLFMGGKFGARDMVNTMLAEFARLQAQKLTASLFTPLMGGLSDSIGGWVGGLFGGGKASGGPVEAGRFYEVAEQGPELLSTGGRHFLMMGNQSGHVSPNPSSSSTASAGSAPSSGGEQPALTIKPTVYINAPGVTARTKGGFNGAGEFRLDVIIEQIEEGIGRRIGQGKGLAPTMEHRYGLNPAAGAMR